jgi:hypothetical protein
MSVPPRISHGRELLDLIVIKKDILAEDGTLSFSQR